MSQNMKNKVKNIIKHTPFYRPIKYLWDKIVAFNHKIAHNRNPYFYTLSPNLLIAIVKAFNIQHKEGLCKGGFGFYEFGLFKGFSFWFAEQISREYADSNFHLYGFDSFEGLPASSVDKQNIYWTPGGYAASMEFVVDKLKMYGADFSKINIFKGFFSKHLFAELKQKTNFLPVSICVIDSDIYESCVEVLSFIKDYLVKGSIILFDDYNVFEGDPNHGERKAFTEFQQENKNIKAEFLYDYGWHGAAFRITNI